MWPPLVPRLPWSSAGRAKGLECVEGRLMTRLAELCGALEVPCAMLEQVDNFPRHAHHAQVMQVWQQSGYSCRWQRTLDLLDILPASRRRYLAVLVHASVLEVGVMPQQAWPRAKRPTLDSEQGFLPLPRKSSFPPLLCWI